MDMQARLTDAGPKAVPLLGILVVLALLVGGGTAVAQPREGAQASQPQRPVIIIQPNDVLRGPPAPPERYIAPPRSGQEISPPMPRPEPLPQMSPRIGN